MPTPLCKMDFSTMIPVAFYIIMVNLTKYNLIYYVIDIKILWICCIFLRSLYSFIENFSCTIAIF